MLTICDRKVDLTEINPIPDGAGETLVLLGIVVLQGNLEFHRLLKLARLLLRLLQHSIHTLVQSLTGNFRTAKERESNPLTAVKRMEDPIGDGGGGEGHVCAHLFPSTDFVVLRLREFSVSSLFTEKRLIHAKNITEPRGYMNDDLKKRNVKIRQSNTHLLASNSLITHQTMLLPHVRWFPLEKPGSTDKKGMELCSSMSRNPRKKIGVPQRLFRERVSVLKSRSTWKIRPMKFPLGDFILLAGRLDWC